MTLLFLTALPSLALAQRDGVRSIADAPRAVPQRELVLTVGEQTSIPATDVRSYSEGAAGIVDVRLPQDGSQFVLVGKRPGTTTLLTILKDGTQVQYRIIVKSSYGHNEQVERKDNIRLDFYFVQLSESYNHNIGVSWPTSVSGGVFASQFNVLSGSFSGATISVADQVLPRLDIAESKGWAKILRHTAMIATNGNETKFNSGGEVNISVQGALTAEIRRIEFGSGVRVLPRYDRDSSRLELTVLADVSELTDPGPNGVPGRTISTLETVINLQLGQSLVLAGLDAQTVRNVKRGLPGLSRIPILGGLFGTNTRQSEGVKNLLVMVPSVVQAIPQDTRSQIRRALQIYNDYKGDVATVALPQVAR